jgi:hypothetical protein
MVFLYRLADKFQILPFLKIAASQILSGISILESPAGFKNKNLFAESDSLMVKYFQIWRLNNEAITTCPFKI